MTPEEELEMKTRIKQFIENEVAGTPWAPMEGGILVDCVVLLGFYNPNNTHGSSFIACTSDWAARGLIEEARERNIITYVSRTEHDHD